MHKCPVCGGTSESLPYKARPITQEFFLVVWQSLSARDAFVVRALNIEDRHPNDVAITLKSWPSAVREIELKALSKMVNRFLYYNRPTTRKHVKEMLDLYRDAIQPIAFTESKNV